MKSTFEQIEALVLDALAADGDLIELGVYEGDTFLGLAALAQLHNRECHAVDSFHGMPPPTARDVESDGVCRYPRGAMRASEYDFACRVRRAGVSDAVSIYAGWIPEVLREVSPGMAFCFAHVDLDQFAPTLAALEWVWPRMSPEGIVCCHDYFAGKDHLASAAINTWHRETRVDVGGVLPSRHIWFRKP